jgi:hypothetical protein
MVSTDSGRFNNHGAVAGTKTTQYCSMSKQRIPVTGLNSDDFIERAVLVADLAGQLQDLDPTIVWDFLTALPAAELQRMMMVALAAVPVDQTLTDVFGWVCDLPTATAVTA